MNDGFQKSGFCVVVARWGEMLYKIATPPAQALRSADVDLLSSPEAVLPHDDADGDETRSESRSRQELVAMEPAMASEDGLHHEHHPGGRQGEAVHLVRAPDLPCLGQVEDRVQDADAGHDEAPERARRYALTCCVSPPRTHGSPRTA